MIRFRVTDLEFDQERLFQNIRDGERRALSRVGFAIRKTALSLIKPGHGRSQPGSPPHSHTNLLTRAIRYAVDRSSVTVGPEILSRRSTNALAALEHGGTSTTVRGRLQQVKARPFMGPSFGIALSQQLPESFANTVKRD